MVEHLLCKQGVIGSNPIVSMDVRWDVKEGQGSALDPPKGGCPLETLGWQVCGLVFRLVHWMCPRKRGVV